MAGGMSVKEEVPVDPFREAVMLAVPADTIVPAFTEKTTLDAPAGTVTGPGAASDAEFPVTTSVVAAATALDSVTMQEAEPPWIRLAAAHWSDEISAGRARETGAFATAPFRVAVIVAVALDVNAFAVALKVAFVFPEGTVTDDGVARLAESEARATIAPLAPAGALRLTVQTADADGASEAGLQEKPLIRDCAGDTVTIPPVAVTGSAVPARDVPSALPILTDPAAALGARTTVTIATTPSRIALPLIPYAIQV